MPLERLVESISKEPGFSPKTSSEESLMEYARSYNFESTRDEIILEMESKLQFQDELSK